VSLCVLVEIWSLLIKKSGLHIEVPSVYMADVQSVSVYIDSRQREYGDNVENPVFLREELFLQICVFNWNHVVPVFLYSMWKPFIKLGGQERFNCCRQLLLCDQELLPNVCTLPSVQNFEWDFVMSGALFKWLTSANSAVWSLLWGSAWSVEEKTSTTLAFAQYFEERSGLESTKWLLWSCG